jgi:hypothetical protein
MKKTVLSMLMALGTLSADTLVLRDGAQVRGTMLNANSRSMTFADTEGRRREYDIANVQEVRFGDNLRDNNNSNSRYRSEPLNMPSSSTVDLVSRLNEDVKAAVERVNLSTRQRQMLEDAQSVIARAWHDLRENLSLSSKREVQVALDNIRYVMNGSGIRAADRRVVLADIAELREKYPDFAGTAGTRSGSRQ